MLKKTSVGGAYARKEPYDYDGTHYDADVVNNDVVKILNSGDVVSGEFGEQHVFSIMTRNGEKNATFNQSSVNALIDVFGDDSDTWVNREVRVLTKKDVVANKKVIIAYYVPKSYMLNEWGELVKGEEVVEAATAPVSSTKPAYPAYTAAPNFEPVKTEALDAEDIPF